MMIQQTSISECIILKPLTHEDVRGRFTEIYKHSALQQFKPVQSNYSISKKGVLRGIHRTPYAKLVTCIKGSIYDVCIDLRPDSNTYKQTFGIELNSSNLYSLYIPQYCGHAFLALEESIVLYHQDGEYDAALDETYCHQHFDIKWPIKPQLMSTKDRDACDPKFKYEENNVLRTSR